jgi:glyoxylase-like metal-dependent hydrolase (beta-lactamase superfamily II)
VLRQVAEGVLIHDSEFVQSNAVLVQGRAGVLLIDPGVPGPLASIHQTDPGRRLRSLLQSAGRHRQVRLVTSLAIWA